VRILGRWLYLGDPFEVSMNIIDMLDKVMSVRITRGGLILFFCVSEEQKEWALQLKKILDWNASYVDLQSRAVIAGVALEGILSTNVPSSYAPIKLKPLLSYHSIWVENS
jgi:hypothetical protein